MSKVCDLHVHSTASDGQYTPARLVEMAGGRGIEVLALTDHDTIDGLEEAILAGEASGLRVLPGIELSAGGYDTFHILGYCFDPSSPALHSLCRRVKKRREERNSRLLSLLREHGIVLSLDEITEIAGGDIIGRPHFAQAMIRRGYVENSREAFRRYLDTEEYHRRVDQDKPPVQECMEAIKSAGGKVSLAHPYQIGLENDALDGLVGSLVESGGLDAIECFYPKHTPEQTRFYLSLAEKYHIHQTGGSDFHGEKVKPEVQLAAWPLDVDWLLG